MTQATKDIHIWQELPPKQQTQVTALLTQWAVKYILSQKREAEVVHGDNQ